MFGIFGIVLVVVLAVWGWSFTPLLTALRGMPSQPAESSD